eukprot:TRINITY_DN536_c0_g2_i1.p1 TRINITY_DN536_c0_g2~~TRINITY_DN536_c0_g2_i1.p1  ORF type:complete len:344 (+),score=94.59 TRINITY_DN536_c0_g2_i1:132-1163(+)
MQISVNSNWGTYAGRTASLWTVTDPTSGFSADITDFGATLLQVRVPDRNGVAAEVTHTVGSPSELAEPNAFWGAMIGRVANRIGNGKFTLDGKEYSVFRNDNGIHAEHGGEHGWNHRFFDLLSSGINSEGKAELKFKYTSPDGEEGFPGTVSLTVTYIVEPMKIGWTFEASTDQPTIVNVTNHAFWNLDGTSGTIHDHVIQVAADHVTPIDETCLATGHAVPVDGANVDLRQPRTLGDALGAFGDIDNSFVLSGYGKATSDDNTFFAAEIHAPKGGRRMQIFTTEPQLQIYTGNFMEPKHAAVCLEAQRAPNAINHEHLRDQVILRPGQVYKHKTYHVFSVDM